jgi:hypothetical protein
VSRAHLVHPSGDKEQDTRRLEHLSWLHYLRMARVLANTPVNAASDARKRVAAAKADFAQAWRALDEVSP